MKVFLGHAKDAGLRYAATSGGVGSAILCHLFRSGKIGTALSFDFNSSTLRYVPRLIYSWEDYHPTGSIYQEIDLLGFLRSNTDKILGRFACFCLPCQTASVRSLMKQAGHACIILGLTCSSQQELSATECLLKLLHIRKEAVDTLQYRGGGWPGGISIGLKNGKQVFVPNNGSLWTDIFHSRLCILERCLYCRNTLNDGGDISLADPWLPEIRNCQTDGETLVMVRTHLGHQIVEEMAPMCSFIPLDEKKAFQSQGMTIRRKDAYAHHPSRRKWLLCLRRCSWYKRLVFSSPAILKLHRMILARLKL